MSAVSITSINGKRCTAVQRMATSIVFTTSLSTSTISTMISLAPAISTTTPLSTVGIATVEAASNTIQSTTSRTTSAMSQTTHVVTSAIPVPVPVQVSNAPSRPTTTAIQQSIPPILSSTSIAKTSTAALPVVASNAVTSNVPLVSSRPIQNTTPLSTSASPVPPITATSNTAAISLAVGGGSQGKVSSVTSSSRSIITSHSIVSSSASGQAVLSTSSPSAGTPVALQDNDTQKTRMGSMVGGIVGGVAFVAILAFLLWFFIRKRRQQRRSFSQRLSTPTYDTKSGFYDVDNDLTRMEGFKETLSGAVLNVRSKISEASKAVRLKFTKHQNAGPSVNLNRGNSQFMERIPQHSRNSSLASVQTTHHERVEGWWQRAKSSIRYKLANHGPPQKHANPFSKSRRLNEKRFEVDTTSDLAHFIDQQRRNSIAKPHVAPLTGHTRSASQQGSLPPLVNPFSDPRQPTVPSLTPRKDVFSSLNTDPFEDPLGTLPVIQSPRVATNRPRAPSSGMPSMMLPTIVELPTPQPSRHVSITSSKSSSSRSTMISISESDGRSTRGRSDPFNLSPPDLSYLENTDVPPLPSQFHIGPSPSGPLPPPSINSAAPKFIPEQSKALPGLSLFGFGKAGLAGIAPGKEGVGRPSLEGSRPSLDRSRPSSDQPRQVPLKTGLPSASGMLRGPPSPIPPRGPTSNLLNSLSENRASRHSRNAPQTLTLPLSTKGIPGQASPNPFLNAYPLAGLHDTLIPPLSSHRNMNQNLDSVAKSEASTTGDLAGSLSSLYSSAGSAN